LEVWLVEMDREKLRRMFPRLAEELETDENSVGVNSVRTDNQAAEQSVSRRFSHYNPDVIDFLRRCETKVQAEEIIAYLEKRGEIDKAYAKNLRDQLMRHGVRSFGSKKESDYYLEHGEV
jgi:hypothetical protein